MQQVCSSRQTPIKIDKTNVNNNSVDKSNQRRSFDQDDAAATLSDQEALLHLTLGFGKIWSKSGAKSTERKTPFACDLYMLAKTSDSINQKKIVEQTNKVGEKRIQDVAQD